MGYWAKLADGVWIVRARNKSLGSVKPAIAKACLSGRIMDAIQLIGTNDMKVESTLTI